MIKNRSVEEVMQTRLESSKAIRLAKQRATGEISVIWEITIAEVANCTAHKDSALLAIANELQEANVYRQLGLDSLQKVHEEEPTAIRDSNIAWCMEFRYEVAKSRDETNSQLANIRQLLAGDVYNAQKESLAQIITMKNSSVAQIQTLNAQIAEREETLRRLNKEIAEARKSVKFNNGKPKKKKSDNMLILLNNK